MIKGEINIILKSIYIIFNRLQFLSICRADALSLVLMGYII